MDYNSKYISTIEEIAEQTIECLLPFSLCLKCTVKDHMFYDKNQKNKDDSYRLVAEKNIVNGQYNIVSYLDELYPFFQSIGVKINEYADAWIEAYIDGQKIIIQDGGWHIAKSDRVDVKVY